MGSPRGADSPRPPGAGQGPEPEPWRGRRSGRDCVRRAIVLCVRRVFLETYGCQMNVADSEVMAGVLERAGMFLATRPEEADAILINTCAIREHAEQRVLGRLGDFVRLKALRPELVVGVAGCMAQHLRGKL